MDNGLSISFQKYMIGGFGDETGAHSIDIARPKERPYSWYRQVDCGNFGMLFTLVTFVFKEGGWLGMDHGSSAVQCSTFRGVDVGWMQLQYDTKSMVFGLWHRGFAVYLGYMVSRSAVLWSWYPYTAPDIRLQN